MWLQVETLRSNVLGVLNLADVCLEKGLHLPNFATGCIYEYDKDFPLGSGKGFKEDDTPNFLGMVSGPYDGAGLHFCICEPVLAGLAAIMLLSICIRLP